MSIVSDLTALIDASGLVGDYSQTNFFNEANYPEKTVSYRITGGAGSDYLVRNPTADFTIYGIKGGASAQETYDVSNALFEYFNDNYKSGCIVGIILLNEVTTAQRTDSDRPFCTFTIQLKIAR
jgi:hypothetical protein